MNLYLDTSALVKLYINESGRDLVALRVREAEMIVTSTVTYAEVRSTFARVLREGRVSEITHQRMVDALARDWNGLTTLSVVDKLLQQAGALAQQHALRGFDAIHLASALHADGSFGDVRFLAFNVRLMVAAQDTGLDLLHSPT